MLPCPESELAQNIDIRIRNSVPGSLFFLGRLAFSHFYHLPIQENSHACCAEIFDALLVQLLQCHCACAVQDHLRDTEPAHFVVELPLQPGRQGYLAKTVCQTAHFIGIKDSLHSMDYERHVLVATQ